MDKEVIITPQFSRQANRIYRYLFNEWSAKVAFEFTDKIWIQLQNISKYPGKGKPSAKKQNVRSVILKPHNRIYYKVTHNTIYILSIFDIRRHPSKNPY